MAKMKVPRRQVFTEYMVPVADPVIVVGSRANIKRLGQRLDLQSIILEANPVHDLCVAHEYCMEVCDIDRAALAVEVNFVDRTSGHGHYAITPRLYRIIMEDLSKDIHIVFGRSQTEEGTTDTTGTATRRRDQDGKKISVQCYPPPRWAANTQYSAIKMYFHLRSNNGVHQYNVNGEVPSFLWMEGSLVVEVWPEIPLDRQTYCIFATASRADRLHSFEKGDRRRFLSKCARALFGDESVPIFLGARYWPFAYQHPSFRNMAETVQRSGGGKYMCGEWSSPVFEGSINGAINTAQNLFFKMIVDHPSLRPARRLPKKIK